MQLPEDGGSLTSSKFDVGVAGEFGEFTLTSFNSDSSGVVDVGSYLLPLDQREQQLGEPLFCFCVEPTE